MLQVTVNNELYRYFLRKHVDATASGSMCASFTILQKIRNLPTIGFLFICVWIEVSFRSDRVNMEEWNNFWLVANKLLFQKNRLQRSLSPSRENNVHLLWSLQSRWGVRFGDSFGDCGHVSGRTEALRICQPTNRLNAGPHKWELISIVSYRHKRRVTLRITVDGRRARALYTSRFHTLLCCCVCRGRTISVFLGIFHPCLAKGKTAYSINLK